MQRTIRMICVLLIGLLPFLQNLALAADAPPFDSPAAVISAAEDAYGREDFKAFADCFDAAGQKLMNANTIALLAVYVSFTPDTDGGKAAKALFAKYGITDVSKHGDETDDQLNARLAGQIKDPRNFLIESTPVAVPNPNHKKPDKGNLIDLKIEGPKAHATYAVKPAGSRTGYTISQPVTFAQTNSSWKITSTLLFAGPA